MVRGVNFDLAPEQEMLRRTVREFAEQEIGPRAAELDRREEFSCELTRAMGELGLFGMTVSPDYGGHGLDYLSYIIPRQGNPPGDRAHAPAAPAQKPPRIR